MAPKLGLVKILGIPQNFCFEGTAGDIVQQIASFLAVDIPPDVSNVVVGNQEPADLQSAALWIRQSSSGTFVGLYVVSGGSWVQIYPVPGMLIRVTGSTLDVPEGWQRADEDPAIGAAETAFIVATWMPDAGNPGEYLVYDVTPLF